MSERIIHFSAGPAVLPEVVIPRSQAALWDLDGTGIGVMEHSHRGKAFMKVYDRANELEILVNGHTDVVDHVHYRLHKPGSLGGYIDRAMHQAALELMTEGVFGEVRDENEDAVVDCSTNAMELVIERINAEMDAIWYAAQAVRS